MNAGIVASRYAKALLKFVQETGNGDKVYTQAGVLALRMQEYRQLRDYIENHPEIEVAKKLQLLEAALGEPPAMEMSRFGLGLNLLPIISVLGVLVAGYNCPRCKVNILLWQ